MGEKEGIPSPVIVEKIHAQYGDLQIDGSYLRSPQLAPKNQGDGYFIRLNSLENPLLVLVDISLGRGWKHESEGKPITESRILQDLSLAIQGNESKPIYILQNLRQFYPSYLRISRDLFDWGFSMTIIALDKDNGKFKIASMGTNSVGVESQQPLVFSSALTPSRKFFSPELTSRSGARSPIRTATVPFRQRLLVATDGISIQNKGFLGTKKRNRSQSKPRRIIDSAQRRSLSYFTSKSLISPTK